MTYPEQDAPLRTDASFDEMENPDHHKSESPLSRLGIGLVSTFPLDYMHLVCLGVMRRLLNAWKDRSSPQHLPLSSLNALSTCLIEARHHWPSEFSRQPRSLVELDRFKATEFRQFLLYLGPVYLKSVLDTDKYRHFMLLFCSISILISEDLHSLHASSADKLLRKFVKDTAKLYGKESLVYNVHGLIHLSSDVIRFGQLDLFSAFPFENFLGSLKRMLRKTTQPLQQVCSRLKEREGLSSSDPVAPVFGFSVIDSSEYKASNGLTNGLNGTHFNRVRGHSFRLSTHTKDACVYLKSGSIMKIVNFIKDDFGTIFIIGHKFLHKECFFSYPCDSSQLSVFKVKNLSSDLCSYPISTVAKKAVVLPYKDDFVCLPLRHTE